MFDVGIELKKRTPLAGLQCDDKFTAKGACPGADKILE